jgi:gliding motility-associated-like protein
LIGGVYWVTVTDIVGCTGTDSVFIATDNSSCINPPNAFTPNGDNYNDSWVIKNIHLYPEMTLKIFNRWGSIVNEQSGEYIPWDGTFKGEVLPTETYYYILLIGEGYDPFKGTLTIVR